MSKFIDEIKIRLKTGREYNLMEPLSVKSTVAPDDVGFLYEYRFSVEWGRTIHCNPGEEIHIIDNVVKELRDTVYSELNSIILRLERAVYERNEQAIFTAIRDIKTEVYG